MINTTSLWQSLQLIMPHDKLSLRSEHGLQTLNLPHRNRAHQWLTGTALWTMLEKWVKNEFNWGVYIYHTKQSIMKTLSVGDRLWKGRSTIGYFSYSNFFITQMEFCFWSHERKTQKKPWQQWRYKWLILLLMKKENRFWAMEEIKQVYCFRCW